ncbi:hypothetical protein P4H27_24540 [Paenibacillus taichungensis]|uniref:hypothetical protein n=1 Tax=Paenibacillus taichungensis TaxID=484184 RepID=UPI002DBAC9BF|nr:hypothetical protein [Paenibacillus taichungensis]MEC0110139.1 hypothetical protein [Paenibacillus taichungensis]MEC0195494.1 hypothetical protein [Paenibacillus taichungensis]
MEPITLSRKEVHKKNKYRGLLLFIFKELLWSKVGGILVSIFINLVAYSYITNNYRTYMDAEENIKKVLTNTVTITHGMERNIEKVKFDYEISEVVLNKDDTISFVEMDFRPVDLALDASDFVISVGSGKDRELDGVKLYGDGTHGIYIYNRNTNELVNNMISLRYSLREEKEIKEILKTESTSKLAKWFLDTFK